MNRLLIIFGLLIAFILGIYFLKIVPDLEREKIDARTAQFNAEQKLEHNWKVYEEKKELYKQSVQRQCHQLLIEKADRGEISSITKQDYDIFMEACMSVQSN